MMLLATVLVAALSVNTLDTQTLEQYYWDCDTAYMQQRLSGQDMNTCLTVTREFILQRFDNDMTKFWDYWARQRVTEWRQRGYTATGR